MTDLSGNHGGGAPRWAALKALPWRSSFARNVAVLAGATAITQGVALLASPLVTRLYSPQDFGVLATYTSVTSVAIVVAGLRYDVAIPLPEDDGSAANLLALACISVVIVALVVGLALGFSSDLVSSRFPRFAPVLAYRWLVPIGVVGGGLYQALNFWAVRRKAFSRVARTRVTQTSAMLLGQVALGLLALRPLGLLLADAVGRGLGTGTLARAALHEDGIALRTVSRARLREVARAYRRFPLFASWAALLNAVGLYVPPVLIAGYYGAGPAGQFALGQRLLAIPMALIGDAVAQVYLAESSRLARTAPTELASLLRRTVLRLAVTSALPLAVLAVAGPHIFGFVFGAQWAEAGVYVRILVGMVVLQLAVSPVSQTLNVLGRQSWQLAWDTCRAATVVLVFVAGARLGLDARGAVLAYTVTMAGGYVTLALLLEVAVRRAKVAA